MCRTTCQEFLLISLPHWKRKPQVREAGSAAHLPPDSPHPHSAAITATPHLLGSLMALANPALLQLRSLPIFKARAPRQLLTSFPSSHRQTPTATPAFCCAPGEPCAGPRRRHTERGGPGGHHSPRGPPGHGDRCAFTGRRDRKGALGAQTQTPNTPLVHRLDF
jgi:hypothetical protein